MDVAIGSQLNHRRTKLGICQNLEDQPIKSKSSLQLVLPIIFNKLSWEERRIGDISMFKTKEIY